MAMTVITVLGVVRTLQFYRAWQYSDSLWANSSCPTTTPPCSAS
jgi:hypothetical protein